MARSHGLILEDAAVSVRLGQVADGSTPVFGTSFDFKGRCRRLSVEDSVEKVNLKAAADNRKKHRFHSGGGTLTLEGFVKATGYVFADDDETFIGRYIEISTKTLSTLTTPHVWIGAVERWTWEGSVGEGQSENVTIDLDPDFTVP